MREVEKSLLVTLQSHSTAPPLQLSLSLSLMADFSFHSDTDESAVDQILAEAMDHIVLEQVAAINCSSFSNSTLPSHLESRFQRLKTFPSSSKPKPQLNPSNSMTQLKGSSNELKDEKPISDDYEKTPAKEKSSEGKSRSGHVSSPSDSSNSPSGHGNSPKFRSQSGDGKVKKGKSQSGSLSFRSNSSSSSTETVKSGCFWCSPKKVSRKKSGSRNGVVELGLNWGQDDELLSDLKSFSSKEQKKLMKKAIKEEEKIIKEAEKIVKWAKQTSSRMEFSVSDDELSDHGDSGHNFGHH